MPTSTSIVPKSINPDIQKERDAASFDVAEFQAWWIGGADKLKEKREIDEIMFKDEQDKTKYQYLSWEDLYDEIVKDMSHVIKKLRKLQAERNPGGNDIWPKGLYTIVSHGLLPMMHPLSTHITMFVDVINGQGTPEQIEKFGKRAENCNIIGTYAQTELAHGTNVRGIQTRADYDHKTDEFVLNTPNLEAYKWWPGGMGHTANHAMVVAQLYIDGQHKGIQMFIVPLRDSETHMPLPGIDVGEIGRKVGMAGVNQGFLGMKNVRIPRFNMLMKNAKVERDGSFVKSPASKLSYMTMVFTRCLIVNQNAIYLLEAATIATRYAAVRRQSHINPNEPEAQIMDHVTQQLKLFPEIATGIAYQISADYMWEIYEQTVREINNGEYSRLPEMHALSCALKVLCTTDSTAGIERLRLSCGGHGYMASSSIGTIYGNAVAAYTYEGENTVLLLQIGRFLMKSWMSLKNGEKLLPSVSYLEDVQSMPHFPQWTDSWQCIVRALQYAAANKIRIAFESLSRRMESGETQPEASNHTGIELTQAAELHGRAFVAATFLDQITGPKSQSRSPALNNVLQNILELYLVHTAQRHMNDILTFVPMTNVNVSSLQTRLELVLSKLRPDAVAICDGFDFHDNVLNSVLGSYDGNVYQRIFESAKKSPLNQKPVPKSFETYLKPFMKANL